MKKALLAIALCLVLTAGPLAAADSSVGRISSLAGRVLIDQFGKGAFIAAFRGDLLYPSSVVKTGADSSAAIEVQGKVQEIPADATIRVADLLAAGARKSGLPWFSAVGGLIRSFTEAARKTDDMTTLGSRAADVSDGTGPGDMDWALDESDASRLLPIAQDEMREGRYAAALATLARADPAAEPSLAWDLSFWKGFCYFQLEDYGDAVVHLSAAQAAGKASPGLAGTAENRRMLLFQLGSSYYLLGQDKAAIPLLESSLAQALGDVYEPYAALTLARALTAAGEPGKARAVAEGGLKKWRGTAVEKEFAALLR